MAVQLGKRYKDEQTGIEVLCIKPGECNLIVADREMELMQPKVLPSADQITYYVGATIFILIAQDRRLNNATYCKSFVIYLKDTL